MGRGVDSPDLRVGSIGFGAQAAAESGTAPGSDVARRFLHRLAIQAILLVLVLACVALLIHTAPPHRMTVRHRRVGLMAGLGLQGTKITRINPH